MSFIYAVFRLTWVRFVFAKPHKSTFYAAQLLAHLSFRASNGT